MSARRGGALAATIALLAATMAAATARAGEGTGEATAERRWLPEGVVYEPYLAEVRHPGFAATVLAVTDEDDPRGERGDLRFGLKLGGRFGLLRTATGGGGGHEEADRAPRRLWQLSFEAGFYGQFDIESSLDNLGWDGLYGLVLATARADRSGPALRLAVNHISSHVGDEYAERTGRRRIGYTREELALGMALRPTPRWRTYAEAAWGYVLRAEDSAGRDLQAPGRVQAGVEYEAPGSVGRTGRWGLYAAVDANAWEERDWSPSVTVEAGLAAPVGDDRRWRVGVAWYDGQLPVGELFQVDESYALAGVWLDLERPAR